MAVKVRCTVTFTLGGLAADPKPSGVISAVAGKAVRGVFCAGETMGV
jgi:succinate dehydrogenase/fumarate reductase flavoprotein subunit